MPSSDTARIEERTGKLYGELWTPYDRKQYLDSLAMFEKRWLANGEDPAFFQGKRCLDAGCGGGRYSFAMALMGAASVVGIDIGEEGLEDARRRGEGLDLPQVSFRRASVLDLPFGDGEFDFACCSGVLHHTPGIERGLSELHRVLKPGGSAYLLLYGAGGLFWPLNALLRPFAAVLGKEEMLRAMTAAGYPANKRRAVLDDLFVPLLETYSRERLEELLRRAGFTQCRVWTRGRFDHETDAESLLREIATRLQMWEAGAETASSAFASAVEAHCAGLTKSVLAAGRELVARSEAGGMPSSELEAAVIGTGHHRVIAVRS